MFTIGLTIDYEPEIITYVSGLSIPISGFQKDLLNRFVRDLKLGLHITSLSSAFDTLYVFAGETIESSLRNLVKREHDVTTVNSPAFTAFEGFQGNGISMYLNSNYTMNTQGIAYTLTKASLGIYERISSGDSNTYLAGVYSIDASVDVNIVTLESEISVGNTKWNINGKDGEHANNTNGTIGMMIITRGDSGKYLYKNKVLRATEPNLNIGSNMPTKELTFLALNSDGTVNYPTLAQISFGFTGKDLSQENINTITNIFETYMDFRKKGIIT